MAIYKWIMVNVFLKAIDCYLFDIKYRYFAQDQLSATAADHVEGASGIIFVFDLDLQVDVDSRSSRVPNIGAQQFRRPYRRFTDDEQLGEVSEASQFQKRVDHVRSALQHSRIEFLKECANILRNLDRVRGSVRFQHAVAGRDRCARVEVRSGGKTKMAHRFGGFV